MVDIMLATYNGEKYIGELLKSLEDQTFKNWRLIVADDGSTDMTVEIIKNYAKSSNHEVEIHINRIPTGQAKANFFSMFRYVQSPYAMFCDQDDVWLEQKIEKTMNAMLEMEKVYGSAVPILIHCDLKVVSSELKIIDESFFHYSNYAKSFSLNEQLVLNKVTGCTVMINKALLEYLLDRDFDTSKIMMHDSWIALIAQCFGKMQFIDDGLILYRQHGVNSVGAQNTRSFKYVLDKIRNTKENSLSNLSHIIEVKYFSEVYGHVLVDNKYRDLIIGYGDLINCSKREYRRYCINNRVLKEPIARALAQLLFAHR